MVLGDPGAQLATSCRCNGCGLLVDRGLVRCCSMGPIAVPCSEAALRRLSGAAHAVRIAVAVGV